MRWVSSALLFTNMVKHQLYSNYHIGTGIGKCYWLSTASVRVIVETIFPSRCFSVFMIRVKSPHFCRKDL